MIALCSIEEGFSTPTPLAPLPWDAAVGAVRGAAKETV